MKTTVSQIAQEVGFSVATVDRALNDRGGVKQRTREIVLAAARRMGYFGPAEIQPAAEVHIDFILPGGSNSFIANLRKDLLEEATSYGNVLPNLHVIDGFDPYRVAARLHEMVGKTDAVGVVAPDHPAVREAINRLATSGVRVATLVSDIRSVTKVGYIGIDNRAAGRLAGLLTGRFLHPDNQHNIVVFIGSPSYRGHEEREMGFRAVTGRDFNNLRISALIEVEEDRDRAYEEMHAILKTDRPSAIYNIGSGTQGIAQALKEANAQHDIVFIAHDLTDATRGLLLDRTVDAVIDQNSRVEAREIIKLLAAAVRGTKEPEYLPRLQVLFHENIPSR